MVFYAYVLALRRRNHAITTDNLKSFASFVFNNGGSIRSLNNEGIMKLMKVQYDSNNEVQRYARYITMQVDLSDESSQKLNKVLKDHPDILTFTCRSQEAKRNLPQSNRFVLDYFSRTEEEINWPPQATADVLDHMDMNWKEFSRTRWSNYLRS
eukprot:PhF_6_TR4623/c0_g1_i1/m.6476